MYKTILICALLLSTYAGHVRKQHGQVTNKKHHEVESRTFNSAFFEFMNVGEADYHLSEKEAQRWAQVSVDIEGQTKKNKQHKSLLETESQTSAPGVIGKVTDLSGNAGVVSYTVTDLEGNILEQDAGDHLAKQLYASYLQTQQELEKGPAQVKLETDLDNIIREDQMEQEKKEEEQRKALEGTELQGQE